MGRRKIGRSVENISVDPKSKKQKKILSLRIIEIHRAIQQATNYYNEDAHSIPDNKRVTKPSLQKILKKNRSIEVSTKTIQRDIDYMVLDLGCPIKWDPKIRTYYYADNNFELPAFLVDNSELFALFLGEKLLDQYKNTPIYDSLESVFGKLKSVLTGASSAELIAQEKFTVFPPFSTYIDPCIWETVVEALKNSLTLEIRYKVPGKEPKLREIDPYHAVRYEGDWYIIGHCHLRNDIRTFSISRIRSANILEKSFHLPPNFDFNDLVGSHFGIYWSKSEEYQVRILFDKSISDYILEREWHPTQKLQKLDDGSILLFMKVNHLMEVKRWVLSWGEHATVLEPEQLKNDIKNTYQKALARTMNS